MTIKIGAERNPVDDGIRLRQIGDLKAGRVEISGKRERARNHRERLVYRVGHAHAAHVAESRRIGATRGHASRVAVDRKIGHSEPEADLILRRDNRVVTADRGGRVAESHEIGKVETVVGKAGIGAGQLKSEIAAEKLLARVVGGR